MKALRSYILDRAEKLQRRSGSDSVVSLTGSKGRKKKGTVSVPNVEVDEDIHISHDIVVQEGEEIINEIVPVSPAVLSVTECEHLLVLNIKEMERALQKKFELMAETNLRDAILLDYYVSAVYWAQQQNYTATKLSDFATVMHALINEVNADHASLLELITDLQAIISGSGKENGSVGKSLQFFSKEEKKAVAEYFYSSLFQHLKLYHYVFCRGQAEEIIVNELSVELPLPAETPFPPALDEGMSENILTEYLLLETPSSEADMNSTTRTPSDIEMASELVEVFAKLTQQDVKNIINEASVAVLSHLQSDFESKMKTHEATMLGRIRKIRGDETSNTAVQ